MKTVDERYEIDFNPYSQTYGHVLENNKSVRVLVLKDLYSLAMQPRAKPYSSQIQQLINKLELEYVKCS